MKMKCDKDIFKLLLELANGLIDLAVYRTQDSRSARYISS
jgi:hypothetical protein